MTEPVDEHSDRQLQFLYELLAEHASIDGDVVEIGVGAWVIHGVLPYDGEVPLAVFDTYDQAVHVLDEVRWSARPSTDP